ncbi:ATP-dependent DNA helicase DinG [Alkalihalobacillus sp. BA299]|uniref:ATP-dependent DNA helicase DinG n=1 Tax=Alkalihalobacillus sp. BA299 TaxID=2815938 RepID=UPI0027DD4DDC|nr:ATP-dependent DNA helicase DinG [Alkalihalobacillus sp. BA299]
MIETRFVVVDIETTGHSAEQDRIIQIGAVLVQNGEIIKRFTSFVNPQMNIPSFIESLTGITDDMVALAPTFEQVIPELLQMLEGSFFVAHNAQFDLSFLQAQLDEVGYRLFQGPVIDTVELSRLLLPNEESYKLQQLAESFNFQHDRPHQADSDAEVTALLLLKMLSKLENLPLITLQKLKEITARLKSDFHDLLEPIITRKLTSYSTDADFGYDIYRQIALRKKSVAMDTDQGLELPLLSGFVSETFTNSAEMHKIFPNYSVRQGQLKMIAAVFAAYESRSHLLVEAGTGTGKSLGYLLPSIFYAKAEKKRVVISTHTIPLQQQLLDQDIPKLKKLLPFPFRAALLKGRNHYLCLRKFEQRLQNHGDDNYDTLLSKGQILIWLTETLTGDVEELNLPSGGRSFWHEVQSESNTCLGPQCPWFSRCFYQQAKKAAQTADLIITNHALLFTDVAEMQTIIPSYSQVVIDEAHHFEDVASNHLGVSIDFHKLAFLFNRLGTTTQKGYVQAILSITEKYGLSLIVDKKSIEKKIESAKVEIDELFRMLHSYVLKMKKSSSTEIGRLSYRYRAPSEQGTLWQCILECSLRVHSFFIELTQLLEQFVLSLTEVMDNFSYKEKGTLNDFQGLITHFNEVRQNIEQLLLEYDPNAVYWMEIEEKGAKNATYLYKKHIHLSETLADQFFAKKASVVLTSATLSVKGAFAYMIERLGLADFGPKTLMLPSPFDYANQSKLYIPTDTFNINEQSERFIEDIADKIIKLAQVTKGRMLILFTSFVMLKQTYQKIKEVMGEEEFYLIGQGINSSSRSKLIKTFKQSDQAILFGTSSFWEGIDIPGEDLSCLVIVRLPFSPPDDPVLQARSEQMKLEGKNPFMNLALPQAILRFKQGVGRLIRSEQDRGVIVVMDQRISTTRYGKMFIHSIPDIPVIKANTDELLFELKEWYKK